MPSRLVAPTSPGFRVEGPEFQGPGFRVEGLGFRV